MTTATRQTTTLTNDFHNTEYRTRKTREELDRIAAIPAWDRTPAEAAFVRRVARALCGIEGCTCGTTPYNER